MRAHENANSGPGVMENEWREYIQSSSLAHSFEPLRSTERKRYGPIINEARKLECQTRSNEGDAERNLRRALPLIHRMELYLKKLPDNRRGRGRPKKDTPPTQVQIEHDRGTLTEGVAMLQRQSERREECLPRHCGRRFECIRSTYDTRFGILEAMNYAYVMPDMWYMNHRPGDPIVRIQSECCRQGSENDTNPRGLHGVVLEGIVPFNKDELTQRFTRYAFHSFTSMAVAFVSFKPETPHSTPPTPLELERLERLERLAMTEFEDLGENEIFDFISSLSELWRAMYGGDSKHFPVFVKRQIRESITRFREMGWLMCKLEEKDWNMTRLTFWSLCKTLLETMTGEEAVSLAQAHVQLTLDAEASEKLEDQDTGHFLIYCQSNAQRQEEKLQDLYDPDGQHPYYNYHLTPQHQLDALCRLADKYLDNSARWLNVLQYQVEEAARPKTSQQPTPSPSTTPSSPTPPPTTPIAGAPAPLRHLRPERTAPNSPPVDGNRQIAAQGTNRSSLPQHPRIRDLK
ncbi:hypothetical protein F5Y18DRAFT_434178 [Xylariaceae sp. FL1019]|nr:hypothetical protein F5Y18DRAFT_434178 [Xylariaceae sp. FL1019]